jgi:hypothetical protein
LIEAKTVQQFPPSTSMVRRQGGFGLAQLLIVLVLVVFFISLAIKMVPSYMTYFQVRGVMDRVVEKPEIRGAGAREVLSAIGRQLDVDGVRSVTTKDFGLERARDATMLVLDYSVQQHIGLNVDVVMHFDHRVELPRR